MPPRPRLRLSSTSQWLPSSAPLRLFYKPPIAAPPGAFPTLAGEPASASIAAPHVEGGPRLAQSGKEAVVDPPVAAKGKGREVWGVEVPVKPPPPAPDECCQSGCATCTYDLYLEDLQHYHERLSEAKTALTALEAKRGEQIPHADWPEEFGPREAPSADAGEVKDQAKAELERARAALPPAMRAFLEMEERMKNRQKQSDV